MQALYSDSRRAGSMGEHLVRCTREVSADTIEGADAATRLGILDIRKPDYGDATDIRDGEVPVFWGCGVTPQLAATLSPEVKGVCVGHGPGRMICLDVLIKDMLR